MDIFFSVTNTALLVILFFYQRNRNQVLSEHLAEQRKLIDETKSVVTQQATALEGQGKVVETALKYTEAFDPKKLEAIVRREIDLEHKEKMDDLKKDFEGRSAQASGNVEKLVNMIVGAASNAAAQASMSFVEPMLPHVTRSLLSMSKDDRSKALALFPEHIRKPFAEGIEQIEAQICASPNRAG